jgi:hypothetical protein
VVLFHFETSSPARHGDGDSFHSQRIGLCLRSISNKRLRLAPPWQVNWMVNVGPSNHRLDHVDLGYFVIPERDLGSQTWDLKTVLSNIKGTLWFYPPKIRKHKIRCLDIRGSPEGSTGGAESWVLEPILQIDRA